MSEMPQKKLARLWIALEPETKEALDHLAEIGKTTKSAISRKAINEFLDKPTVKALLNTPLLAFCSALFFMID